MACCTYPRRWPTPGARSPLLWDSDLPFEDPLDDVLAVEVAPESLEQLCGVLLEGLSEAELKDSKAVLVEKGSTPGLGMLSRTQNLSTFTATIYGGWLLDMMREDRITTHFQPIVPAIDPDEVFGYECLLRGLDEEGGLVSPRRMFDVARRAGLLFNLDRAARIKAIQEASGLGLESNIFINFNPTSIYDPAYCLKSTLRAIKGSNLSPDQVVFEVTESEKAHDAEHLKRILDFYRESGFRTALDDLGSGYSSLNLLAALRPDFVKLDMGLVQGVDQDPYKAAIASRLLELARDLGTSVIAEGVETEEQWRWLHQHGADFVQGYFFARPGSPPPVPERPAAPAEKRNPSPAHP